MPRFSSTKETQIWLSIIRMDPCSYCGRVNKPITIDHVAPFSQREKGRTRTHLPNPLKTWENLVPACEACNRDKSDLSLTAFLVLYRHALSMRRASEGT